MLGRTLDGRFTILSRLGAGSMGTVYRARQHAMGREVAIKILRSDKAMDETSKGRFLREARANSLLASPHTVTVFDFGQSDTGELFLAMELLEGESLGQRITRVKRLPVDMAIDTCRQALRSLAEAHAKGIIHRDLKPDNLFFARMVNGGQHEEMVKVLDFGIAKMMGEVNEPLNAIETQAGTVFGTPRYMSPEQAQAKPLDARSDLYSLGVILYHMLSGRPPFTDDDAIVVMARHIKTAPTTLSLAAPDAHIPAELEQLVMRVLAKEPSGRPSSAEAMSQELARVLESLTAGTSGVRVSLVTGSPFGPAEALAAAQREQALGENGTLETAAGLPRKRTGLFVGFLLVVLVAALAIVLRATVFQEPVRASGPPSMAPLGAVATSPAVGPTPTLAASSGRPDPGPQPATAVIPQVSFNDLPRAAAAPATPPPAPTKRVTRPSSGRPSTPASSASSHYGYLE